VRERLEKIEDMKHFSFKTDADFKGAETKSCAAGRASLSRATVRAGPAPPLVF